MADLESILFIVIAFLCTVGSIALAIFHIYRHLLNYTEPIYQRYIVRIIFMVPVYALMSFLSLILPDSSIYFNSIREVYEAWVIYNFLSLCLAWVGGPGAVVLSLTGRVLKPSCYLMTCCLPPLSLDGRFIRRCKQGCLQFVILKPFLAAVTLILYANGNYHDGNFNPRQSYLYLTIIYTISYSLALYALALFYVACKDLLQPFNPVPKFIIIKSVVFLTYWQGVLVFLAAKSGFIKDADQAARFQDFIICVEMLIAAIGHLYAFPYKEYAGANVGGSHGLIGSLTHAVKLNDLYHDTVHQRVKRELRSIAQEPLCRQAKKWRLSERTKPCLETSWRRWSSQAPLLQALRTMIAECLILRVLRPPNLLFLLIYQIPSLCHMTCH
ncbi:transmembrane protein 184A-like isoform X2 [Punica granatum]|uniref:Transmembrane protein 184A-like isoform X2 n=1 Tax=Punica granatum TaxID=22663 RepID=A0A6P8E9R4_PUNGR|nr:transmembrane protein 184A-like isoform X2 [Punica granatum]